MHSNDQKCCVAVHVCLSCAPTDILEDSHLINVTIKKVKATNRRKKQNTISSRLTEKMLKQHESQFVGSAEQTVARK